MTAICTYSLRGGVCVRQPLRLSPGTSQVVARDNLRGCPTQNRRASYLTSECGGHAAAHRRAAMPRDRAAWPPCREAAAAWPPHSGLRRGCGGGFLLVVVALVDALLLTVANQPAEHLRFVDADEDVVDRLVHGRIVDDLPRRPFAGVDLLHRLVELVDELLEFGERLVAVLLVVQQARDESLSFLQRRAEEREIRGGRLQVLDEVVNLLLPFRIAEQRGQRAVAGVEILLHLAGDRRERRRARAERRLELIGELVVVHQLADHALAALDMREQRVRLVERRQHGVGHALLRFRSGGQLAEDTFAAVDTREDVLQRVGDLHEVVDEVLTRRDQLIDVRLALYRDDRAWLECIETRTAGRDVDVVVAGEEAELLQPRARIAADALRVFAIDHQRDVDVFRFRIARQADVLDHADRDAGDLHRVALGESGHAVEADFVFVLAREDLLLRSDEEEEDHQHDERDRNEEADADRFIFLYRCHSVHLVGCAAETALALKNSRRIG